MLAIGIPSVASASARAARCCSASATRARHRTLTKETQIIASNSTYGTRQSNKKDRRRRRRHLRLPLGRRPRAVHPAPTTSRAAARSSSRPSARRAAASRPATRTGAPFTTNATGVATGLNADKVDGRDGSDIASPSDSLFAAVNADGTLAAGGPEATGSTRTDAAAETYTVTFNRDVSKCSYTANVTGSSADFSLGVEGGPAANQVRVDQRDAAGGNTGPRVPPAGDLLSLARRRALAGRARPRGRSPARAARAASRQPGCSSIARRTAAIPRSDVAGVDLRQPGPEQQLVGLRRQLGGALGRARPASLGAVGGHQLVGLARQLVGARQPQQPPRAPRPAPRGPRRAARSAPPRLALARHHHQRRGLAAADVAALALGGVAARPSGGRRGRPSRPRSPPPSRRARSRGPSCWPARRRARRSRGRRRGCSLAGVDGDPARARRRSRPGAPPRARRARAAPRSAASARRRRPPAGRARAGRGPARPPTASRPRRCPGAPRCRASRRRTSASARPRRARRSRGRRRRSSTCRAARRATIPG